MGGFPNIAGVGETAAHVSPWLRLSPGETAEALGEELASAHRRGLPLETVCPSISEVQTRPSDNSGYRWTPKPCILPRVGGWAYDTPPAHLLLLVFKPFAYFLIGTRNAAWHDVARGCDRRLLGSRNVAMQRRAGPRLLGRGGVARCPKGFSELRPPPSGPASAPPGWAQSPGFLPVHTLCHSVILWAPEPGTLGLCNTCLCACWCGGGGVRVECLF